MERYFIIFICLIGATFAGAVCGVVYAKFGPAAAFVLFCVVGSMVMALTKPVGGEQQ